MKKTSIALIPRNQFLSFVQKKLAWYYGAIERRRELFQHGPMILKILSVDLSRVHNILKGQYSSSKKGKKG